MNKFNIGGCDDYVWVTKDELLEYFPDQAEYLKQMIISWMVITEDKRIICNPIVLKYGCLYSDHFEYGIPAIVCGNRGIKLVQILKCNQLSGMLLKSRMKLSFIDRDWRILLVVRVE